MMTTDLITFFHPDGSTGKDWVFSPQFGDAAAEVWIFDRGGKANFSRFACVKVSSEEEFKSMIGEIYALLQQSGGIYFYAYDHNGVIRGKMAQVESAGYAPPKRLLRLSPSNCTRFEDITGRADFAPGDHLVIPVSATAEQRLQAFYNDLEGFPSDLQAVILNVIRRPSLEWRIHRLERTISGLPPVTQAAQQKEQARRGSWLDKIYHAVMWKIPIGPVIAALLLLASTVAAYDKYFAREEQSTETETIDDDAEPETSASSVENADKKAEDTQQKGSTSQSLDNSLKELYAALQTSKNSNLKKLYENHFKDPGNKPTTTGWGMAKLQALQLDLIKPNDKILEIADNPTAVKELYRSKALSAIAKESEASQLLTWSCCHYFKAAALPAVGTKPALPLSEKGDCNLGPQDALPGLQNLIDWVGQQE